MDLNITWSCCVSHIFYHGILQRNYRKMTIKWSFSYNSFVKFPLYKHDSLVTLSIPMDPKYSVIKGLHCMHTSKVEHGSQKISFLLRPILEYLRQ